MAYRVRLVPRAQWDLSHIYDRVGAGSSEAARTWYLGLRSAIRSLKISPNRCPVTSENRDLRHLLYGKKPHVYRVIYSVDDQRKEVEILHIRHGAMAKFEPDQL